MKKIILVINALLCLSFYMKADAVKSVTDTLDYDRSYATSPADILKGRISGVRVSNTDGNPNSAKSTIVRSVNSLRGDSQPLWIVDGTPLVNTSNVNNYALSDYAGAAYLNALNQFDFINPYDIESIEVLKDLSATAIYGSRGANGVVIVKTKRFYKEGTTAEWNSNLQLSSPAQSSPLFRTAFSHNHAVRVSSRTGNSAFNISAFFRDYQGVVKRNANRAGGLRLSYDTHANSVVWFGTSVQFGIGGSDNVTGPTSYGGRSMMTAIRTPYREVQGTAENWNNDYDDSSKDYHMVYATYLQFNFLPNLNLRADLGAEYLNASRLIWYGKGTKLGNDENGVASNMSSGILGYSAKVKLEWNPKVKNHEFKAYAGGEAFGNSSKYNKMDGSDFYTHVLRAKGLNLHASKSVIDEYTVNLLEYGAFAGLSYNYDRMAGVNLTGVFNWTPRYFSGKPTLYYSADAYVDVRRIAFPQSETVSTLKLVAGYGTSGRQFNMPYAHFDRYLAASYPTVLPDLEFFYEGIDRASSAEMNAGLQLGFLNDRINVSYKAFSKRTADVFNAFCFGEKSATYLWVSSPAKEFFTIDGSLRSFGHELDLDAEILKVGGFRWTVNANVTYNRVFADRIDAKDKFGMKVGGKLSPTVNLPGEELFSFYGYKYEDGEIKAGKTVLGNPFPKIYGGFGTTLSYANFNLDLAFDGAALFDIADLVKNDVYTDGSRALTGVAVRKGDYLRLSRVSFSYDYLLKKKCFFKGFRVTLSGLNLLTFTGYDGWNPDVNCFARNISDYGIDYGCYPAARGAVLGIKLLF